MDTPKLNVKKIVEIWDWIEFKAGTEGLPAWMQTTWVTDAVEEHWAWMDHKLGGQAAAYEEEYCGTGCCVAGFATLDVTDTKTREMIPGKKVYNVEGESMTITRSMRGNFQDYAAFVLGLTLWEAGRLFDGDNTKDDIRRILNKILENRGEAIRL